MANLYCEICYQPIIGQTITMCNGCENDFHFNCFEKANVENCPICKAKDWNIITIDGNSISATETSPGSSEITTETRYDTYRSSNSKQNYIRASSDRYRVWLMLWAVSVIISVAWFDIAIVILTYLFVFLLLFFIRLENEENKKIIFFLIAGVAIPTMIIYFGRILATIYTFLIIITIVVMLDDEIVDLDKN